MLHYWVQAWVWYSPGIAVLLERCNVAVLGGRFCDLASVGGLWGLALRPGVVASHLQGWPVTIGWGVAGVGVTECHASMSCP